MADIDLSGQEWTPLCSSSSFQGIFDGNGHKIKNMTISDPDIEYAGLFGKANFNSTIKNVALENVNISTGKYIGGIVAYVGIGANTKVSNCYVTGVINNTKTNVNSYSVGGIAGSGSSGTYSDCYVKLDVDVLGGTGGTAHSFGGISCGARSVSNCYVFVSTFNFTRGIDDFGGIVSSCSGNIIDCHVKNTVVECRLAGGFTEIGGIVGSLSTGSKKVQNCSISDSSILAAGGCIGGIIGSVDSGVNVDLSDLYAENTNITCTDTYGTDGIGGIVGNAEYGSGSLKKSYYIGGTIDTSGMYYVGGLMGLGGDVNISNSFATCSVTGNNYVGGLVGTTGGAIENSFFKGSITGESIIGGIAGNASEINNCYSSATMNGDSSVGGFSGLIAQITNSYWDKELSNVIDAYAAEGSIDSVSKGATTAEMKDPATYAGWDETIWNLNTGDTPTLKWYEDLLDQDTTDPVDPNPGGDGGDGGTDPVDPGEGGDGGDGGTDPENPGGDTGTDPDGDGNDGSDTDDSDDDKPNTGGGTAPDTGCDVEVDKDFETGAGKGNVRLQIGAGSNPDTNAIYVDLTFDIDGFFADMTDPDKCLETVEKVDELQSRVKSKQAELGAVLNRLDSVMNTQLTQIENNTAAYSTVMDTDIAQETVNYVKAQIQTQTASSLTIQTRNFYVQIMLNLINSIG